MASSLRTKLRIAASVLFATGFFDAVAGRFLFQPHTRGEKREATVTGGEEWLDLAGALHAHTTYSDGAGDVPTMMAGASEAGVDFVLLSDHNTLQPLRDGWEERYANDTPFLLIGTEITVEYGAFLLALDLPPEWEPEKHLKPQASIDAVLAADGLPLVSLPFDVKHPWREWDATGFEGLEVINLSTIARRHINLLSLAWLYPIYKLQGMQAVLRALVTRPDQAFARWDGLTRGGEKTMIGLGALDAHALMKIGKKKHPLPSYADSFRAAMTHVLVPPAVGGDPPARKREIYRAIRRGRCYFTYDCLGDPRGFDFRGYPNAKADSVVQMGERASAGTLLAVTSTGPHRLIRLYRDGKIVAAGFTGRLEYMATEPGTYRVEVYQYAVRMGPFVLGARPWIFSNPIYIAAAN